MWITNCLGNRHRKMQNQRSDRICECRIYTHVAEADFAFSICLFRLGRNFYNFIFLVAMPTALVQLAELRRLRDDLANEQRKRKDWVVERCRPTVRNRLMFVDGVIRVNIGSRAMTWWLCRPSEIVTDDDACCLVLGLTGTAVASSDQSVLLLVNVASLLCLRISKKIGNEKTEAIASGDK